MCLASSDAKHAGRPLGRRRWLLLSHSGAHSTTVSDAAPSCQRSLHETAASARQPVIIYTSVQYARVCSSAHGRFSTNPCALLDARAPEHGCVHACIHMRLCACMPVCLRAHTRICMHVCELARRARIYTCVRLGARSCMHAARRRERARERERETRAETHKSLHFDALCARRRRPRDARGGGSGAMRMRRAPVLNRTSSKM